MSKSIFARISQSIRPIFNFGYRAGSSRNVIPRRPSIERLESRDLLSGEIMVAQFRSFNATPPLDEPQVAVDGAGNFVVAWGSRPDSFLPPENIFAQRVASNGVLLGSTVQASFSSSFDSRIPSVATDSAGDFIATWSSGGERFDSNGNPLGSTPAPTGIFEQADSVGMDSQGDYAIADGVQVQRFNSTGIAVGSPISLGNQEGNDLAMSPSGNFVVTTWSSPTVHVQAFSANGTPTTGILSPVQPLSGIDTDSSHVSMNASGNFVVTWDSFGSGFDGLMAQLYAPNGTPIGSNILVTTASFLEDGRDVAMLPDGSFDIAWTASSGIYLQSYSPTGSLEGVPSLLSLPSETTADGVSLAAAPNGSVYAVWADYPAPSANGVPNTGEIIAEQIPEPASSIIMLGSAILIVNGRKHRELAGEASDSDESTMNKA